MKYRKWYNVLKNLTDIKIKIILIGHIGFERESEFKICFLFGSRFDDIEIKYSDWVSLTPILASSTILISYFKVLYSH